MPDPLQTQQVFEIIPALTIPGYLVGEVQAKLAYVDESITGAHITPSGDCIRLDLNQACDETQRLALEEKVQRVVTSMVKGAFKPKVQVLEDYLERPVTYA